MYFSGITELKKKTIILYCPSLKISDSILSEATSKIYFQQLLLLGFVLCFNLIFFFGIFGRKVFFYRKRTGKFLTFKQYFKLVLLVVGMSVIKRTGFCSLMRIYFSGYFFHIFLYNIDGEMNR